MKQNKIYYYALIDTATGSMHVREDFFDSYHIKKYPSVIDKTNADIFSRIAVDDFITEKFGKECNYIHKNSRFLLCRGLHSWSKMKWK